MGKGVFLLILLVLGAAMLIWWKRRCEDSQARDEAEGAGGISATMEITAEGIAAESAAETATSRASVVDIRKDETSRPESAAALESVTITCPACKGNGRLVDEARNNTYECPVCAGRGTRARRYRKEVWKICRECEGMGYVLVDNRAFRTRNRMARAKCNECQGRGLVSK